MNKPKPISKTISIGDGRPITIETGKLAKQADGSVVVKQGNTMLLATAVSAKDSNPDMDFMPLSVNYQENYSSFGRFPGGFRKREGRPGDNEILVSRLVDRALRPLFPDDYHAETFVTIQLISADLDYMPDSLAGLAASAALAVSDIPFAGPISEVRVIRLDGKIIINPTTEQTKKADIDLIVAATMENVLMLEGEMDEVSEEDMLEAMKAGHSAIKIHCQAQKELAELVGSTKKRKYTREPDNESFYKLMEDAIYAKLLKTVEEKITDKVKRIESFEKIKEDFIESLKLDEDDDEKVFLIKKYFKKLFKKAVRDFTLNKGERIDGRKTDEIRPIWSEVDYLPAAHGSAIFTRGDTQSLTTVTLGTKFDEQIIDDVMNESRQKFLLHYNFPPYATNDARPYRGTGRREIGHGNLAFRALEGILPDMNKFPYTLRIVSDILESNGSSSMATVCAGTLALMDAGVHIKKPVSGIAMGLMIDTETKKWAVLSDILGDEDHLGDMDFKVTGTKDGITACQMDIKVDGLSYEILTKALEQARGGRLHILEEMLKAISEPNEDLKPHTPRMVSVIIPKDKIGSIIGPGGKIIQKIQKDTESTITIDESEDGETGKVVISAPTLEKVIEAQEIVKGIIAVPETGKTYSGKVVSIVDFGAFVEILPGKEGLLHISEIDVKRVDKVEDVLKVGQEIEVKLLYFNERDGKMKLSHKALLPGGNENRDKRDNKGRSDRRPPRKRY